MVRDAIYWISARNINTKFPGIETEIQTSAAANLKDTARDTILFEITR
jgi:hypothetical protein